jgi:glycosyltransferase involved in cell wall biosynthesis
LLLAAIDWPEPFGLVMIEAMACGTPVLAFRGGSVVEIVEDGVSGCIAETVEQAVHAMPSLLALDRRAVRARFEERFCSSRMVADYVRVYQTVLRKRPVPDLRLSVLAAHPAAIDGHVGHVAAAVALE